MPKSSMATFIPLSRNLESFFEFLFEFLINILSVSSISSSSFSIFVLSRIDTIVLPTVIDTLAVIKGYYESVIAIDTILDDTNGFIVIADSISKNRIQSRTINSMKLYPRVTKVTKYRDREFKKAYFGGIGLVGNEKSLGLKVKFAVLYNPNTLVVTSYDIIRGDFSAGIYWKINFKLFK